MNKSQGSKWHQNVHFGASLGFLYVLTAIFVVIAFQPAGLLSQTKDVASLTKAQQIPYQPPLSDVGEVSGRPIRIVIPASGVDLPIDPGYYDAATDSWNLSGYRAQFAMISTLANNFTGDTFIYGHNNDYVFGALRHNTPAVGAIALLYTDNGHIFQYKFTSTQSLAPDDTSVLTYSGPPMMTIQTCTGSLNEYRTMYRFSFDKVVS